MQFYTPVFENLYCASRLIHTAVAAVSKTYEVWHVACTMSMRNIPNVLCLHIINIINQALKEQEETQCLAESAESALIDIPDIFDFFYTGKIFGE